MKWKLIGKIENVEDFQILDKHSIAEFFESQKTVDSLAVNQCQVNKYSVEYNMGKIVVSAEYSPERKKVNILTNNFIVATEYEKTLDFMYRILKMIKTTLDGNLQEYCDLIIQCEHPLHCDFHSKQPFKETEKAVVRTGKNKIQISIEGFDNLKDSVIEILIFFNHNKTT